MPENIKNYLTNEGFIPVSLPSEGIEVQQIMIREPQKAFKRFPDKVYKLFKEGNSAPVPFTQRDMVVAELKGVFGMNTKGSASLGFMEVLINKIGINLGFELKLEHDEELVFLFEDPRKDEISSFIDLNTYLDGGSVINADFGNKLKDDEIYIITAVLRSSKFSIGIVKKSDLDVALNLPTIKDFVDGEFTFSKDKSVKRVVQYNGDKSLVFAVQAAQLLYDRTLWKSLLGKKGVFRIVNAEGVVVRKNELIKVSLFKDNAFATEE